jgi:hypothetical protein
LDGQAVKLLLPTSLLSLEVLAVALEMEIVVVEVVLVVIGHLLAQVEVGHLPKENYL